MEISKDIKKLSELTKSPVVVWDIETTGLDENNEVIQFYAIRIEPNGKTKELKFLCNPTVKIDSRAAEVHGYTNAALAKEKPFSHFIPKIKDIFKDAVISGFNIKKFDCGVLSRQLSRHGFPNFFESAKIIDVYTKYLEHHPRKLANALKQYTGLEIEDAHDASGDVNATLKVLVAQLEFEKKNVEDFVADNNGEDIKKYFDISDPNEPKFNFGKHKGKSIKEEPGFIGWMLLRDFPDYVKTFAKKWINDKSKSN